MIEIFIILYLAAALLNGLAIASSSETFKRVGFKKQILVLIISPVLLAREFTTRRGK
ncbi:MAG: hypothetical protein PHI38_07085 [Sulfurimonas sp.]|uniref:hypothetical protein n=1 Tax=Sulfurimonas sp. TaxID=2022749 RepID=UPI00261273D1|nr:hypothetical protein [Sulfurimonas sp.]MDD3476617.1 hypothetical protein [Sulfurimonas sp.]